MVKNAPKMAEIILGTSYMVDNNIFNIFSFFNFFFRILFRPCLFEFFLNTFNESVHIESIFVPDLVHTHFHNRSKINCGVYSYSRLCLPLFSHLPLSTFIVFAGNLRLSFN